MQPIAIIHSPFKEKFGVPRQAGLANSVKSKIILEAPYDDPEFLRGLDGFNYIWLIFEFHQAEKRSLTPLSRPPRLGGNKKMGLFATRSPFRPSGLGLSVVKVTKVEGTTITVEGADLLDQTPILDIKPYISYSDSKADATNGWLEGTKPMRLEEVFFSKKASEVICEHIEIYPTLQRELEELVLLDPKPAYKDGGEYSFKYHEFDVDFKYITSDTVEIFDVRRIDEMNDKS